MYLLFNLSNIGYSCSLYYIFMYIYIYINYVSNEHYKFTWSPGPLSTTFEVGFW